MARKTLARTTPAQHDAEAPAPDWRTGRGYPPLTASASEFAWQFLRRNPEYRADWQRYADELRAVAAQSPDLAEFVRWRLGEGDPEYRAGSVRLRRGTWTAPHETTLARKWGLTSLVNPRSDALPGGTPLWTLAPGRVSWLRWSFEADQQQVMDLEQPSQLIVRVDLRVPPGRLLDTLEKLIDRARKELRIDATKARNRPHNKWVMYLRLLDADEAGASNGDICGALWPKLNGTRQRLDKARDTARTLRDSGHITLPLIDRARRKK